MQRPSSTQRFTVLLALWCCTWAHGAAASEPSKTKVDAKRDADTLFNEAGDLLRTRDDWQTACTKYAASHRIAPSAATTYSLGYCDERRGRWRSAIANYSAAEKLAQNRGDDALVARARSSAEVAKRRAPKLRIDIREKEQPNGVAIFDNDALLDPSQWNKPLVVDAGLHRIVVKAEHHEDWTSQVEVHDVDVPVEVPTLRPVMLWGPHRIGAVAATGAGVVGLGVGIVFGLNAISKQSTADEYCGANAWCVEQAGVDAGNTASTHGNIATVASVTGGVLLVSGAALWFTAPRFKPERVDIGLGPAGFAMRAAF